MGATARTVSVALKLAITQFTGPAATVVSATKAMGGEFDTLAKTSKSRFNDVMKMSTGVSLGLIGIAAAAEKAAIGFDKQMSEVKAVSNATGVQLNDLRAAAIAAGKDTAFSATEAAQAEAELAKAGVSVTDILGGGLKGALSLAAAGSLDLADAATDVAQALNIFNLQGSATSHVADVLAAGANTSATDVGELAYSLNQAGLVAHQTGLSLEDTTGVLAAFAQHGLVGSDAGTSFKTMLQALNPTSAKTQSTMAELGLTFYDAQGKFIGITQTAQELKDKLSVLTQQQRDAALAQIFGSDAVRAANVLYSEGGAGIQKWIDGVNDSGAAARTAAAKMDNLSGDVEQLKGSLETLAIEGSGGVTKGLRAMTEGANAFVGAVIDMPPALSETLTILSGVSGVTLLAATGFVKAKSSIGDFMDDLRQMGPSGEKAAEGLGKVGGWLGKAGLWGAGALLAYEGVSTLLGYINKSSGPTKHNIDALSDSLAHFGQTGEVTGELAKVAGKNIDDMAAKLQSSMTAWRGLENVQQSIQDLQKKYPGQLASIEFQHMQEDASRQLNTMLQNTKDLDAGLAQLVSGGDSKDALIFFDQFSAALQSQGFTMGQVNSLFPQYLLATHNAAGANTALASGVNLVTTANGTMVLGLQDAIDKNLKLTDVINGLSGANESYAKDNIAVQQSLADLSKALKDNDKDHVAGRKSLDDSTQAGRDNLNGILKIIDANKAAFESEYTKKLQTEDSVSALTDATKTYDAYIGRLRATLLAEGFNKTAVDNLIASYAKIPPVRSTNVDAPGLAPVYATMTGYSRLFNDIPPDVNTRFMAPGLEEVNDTASGYSRILNDIVPDALTRFSAPGLEHVNDTASGYARILNDIDGKYVSTTVHTNYTSSGRAGQSRQPGDRWGGAYEHAAVGALNEASYYPARNPGRYMIAEPQTMGEAFVPKVGNYGRSMSILNRAAGWYGASVVPGGYGGGRGGAIQILVSATPGAAAAHLEFLRFAIAGAGGDPVAALTPR